jgi:hypothetical protein
VSLCLEKEDLFEAQRGLTIAEQMWAGEEGTALRAEIEGDIAGG